MELGPDLITPHPEFPHPVYLVWVSRVHANRMKMLEIGALHQFGLETELARAVQKKEMQRNTFFFFPLHCPPLQCILFFLGVYDWTKLSCRLMYTTGRLCWKWSMIFFSLSGPVLGAKDGKHWNSYFWAISPSPDVTLHLKIPFLRVWSYCNWNILLRRILFNGPNVTAL